jgi:hypothetical protein
MLCNAHQRAKIHQNEYAAKDSTMQTTVGESTVPPLILISVPKFATCKACGSEAQKSTNQGSPNQNYRLSSSQTKENTFVLKN